MNKNLTPAEQEAYKQLAAVITALAANVGARSAGLMLDGYNNNDRKTWDNGMQSMKMYNKLLTLASCLEKGIMPGPWFWNYFASR